MPSPPEDHTENVVETTGDDTSAMTGAAGSVGETPPKPGANVRDDLLRAAQRPEGDGELDDEQQKSYYPPSAWFPTGWCTRD